MDTDTQAIFGSAFLCFFFCFLMTTITTLYHYLQLLSGGEGREKVVALRDAFASGGQLFLRVGTHLRITNLRRDRKSHRTRIQMKSSLEVENSASALQHDPVYLPHLLTTTWPVRCRAIRPPSKRMRARGLSLR